MNHYITGIQRRVAHDIARITGASAMNSAPVVAYWREADSPAPDPLLVSTHTEEQWQEQSHSFTALVHFVDHSSSVYVAHKEVATGDVILDYPEQEVNFQDKGNIRFLINGSYYVPKKIGQALRDSWDVKGATRTLLLMLQA